MPSRRTLAPGFPARISVGTQFPYKDRLLRVRELRGPELTGVDVIAGEPLKPQWLHRDTVRDCVYREAARAIASHIVQSCRDDAVPEDQRRRLLQLCRDIVAGMPVDGEDAAALFEAIGVRLPSSMSRVLAHMRWHKEGINAVDKEWVAAWRKWSVHHARTAFEDAARQLHAAEAKRMATAVEALRRAASNRVAAVLV